MKPYIDITINRTENLLPPSATLTLSANENPNFKAKRQYLAMDTHGSHICPPP